MTSQVASLKTKIAQARLSSLLPALSTLMKILKKEKKTNTKQHNLNNSCTITLFQELFAAKNSILQLKRRKDRYSRFIPRITILQQSCTFGSNTTFYCPFSFLTTSDLLSRIASFSFNIASGEGSQSRWLLFAFF